MIHLGDNDLNPSHQISSSKLSAVKSWCLWHGDKKRPANGFVDCSSRGFEGIRWWAWQIITFLNTHKQRLVTVRDDVWLYKKLQYMIRSSINKQLIRLDLLSLHRITLCHFYDSDPQTVNHKNILWPARWPTFSLGSHGCSPERRKSITLAYFISIFNDFHL